MAVIIQLTPEELTAQISEMESLKNDFQSIFDSVNSTLQDLNGQWSENLSNNFTSKITSAQNTFSGVVEMLSGGVLAGKQAVDVFTNLDTALAQGNRNTSLTAAVNGGISAIVMGQAVNGNESKPNPAVKQGTGDYIQEILCDLGLYYAADFMNESKDILNSDESLWDKAEKTVKLILKGNSVKKTLEKIDGVEIDNPFFSFLNGVDTVNKITIGAHNYFEGMKNNDIDQMIRGGTDLKKGLTGLIKKAAPGSGPIIDYAIHLSDNIEIGANQYEGGSSLQSTLEYMFIDSAIDTVNDSPLVKFVNLGIDNVVYNPTSKITKVLGFDMDQVLSKYSDSVLPSEKINDGIEEIRNTIRESGGYFENWKSGVQKILHIN